MKKFYWVFPFLLSLIVNFGVLGNGLVYDDVQVFEMDLPRFKKFLDPLLHQNFLSQYVHYYYRPLLWWFFMLGRSLGGQDPFVYHAGLLTIHSVNVLLIYALALQFLSGERRRLGALLAASLFAVHPIHVEVVAWISACVEALLTTFFLLSFLAYLLYRKRPHRKGWLILSSLAFLFSLLIKETALILPLVVVFHSLMIRYSPLNLQTPPLSRKGMVGVATLLPILIYVGLRYYNLGSGRLGFLGLDQGKIIQFISAYGFYVKNLLFPYPLNNYFAEFQPSFTFFSASVMILMGFVVLCWITWNRQPSVCFHLIFFLLTISPACYVSISDVSATPLAERYLYLPSYSLSYLCGYLIHLTVKERKWVLFFFISILVLFSALSRDRIKVWKNEKSFWQYALQRNPDAFAPLAEKGRFLINENKCDQARDHLKKAYRKKVVKVLHASIPYLNLAQCYQKIGRFKDAEYFAKLGLQIFPNAFSFFTLGEVYLHWAISTKDLKEAHHHLLQAKDYCEKALQLDTNDYRIYYCLGKAEEGFKDFARAKDYYQRMLLLAPPSHVVVKEAREFLQKGW